MGKDCYCSSNCVELEDKRNKNTKLTLSLETRSDSISLADLKLAETLLPLSPWSHQKQQNARFKKPTEPEGPCGEHSNPSLKMNGVAG